VRSPSEGSKGWTPSQRHSPVSRPASLAVCGGRTAPRSAAAAASRAATTYGTALTSPAPNAAAAAATATRPKRDGSLARGNREPGG
jgi:hypothetical protein